MFVKINMEWLHSISTEKNEGLKPLMYFQNKMLC